MTPQLSAIPRALFALGSGAALYLFGCTPGLVVHSLAILVGRAEFRWPEVLAPWTTWPPVFAAIAYTLVLWIISHVGPPDLARAFWWACLAAASYIAVNGVAHADWRDPGSLGAAIEMGIAVSLISGVAAVAILAPVLAMLALRPSLRPAPSDARSFEEAAGPPAQ